MLQSEPKKEFNLGQVTLRQKYLNLKVPIWIYRRTVRRQSMEQSRLLF